MRFERVAPPLRWQLCAVCNEIVYTIVSPDECPKCGSPLVLRPPATSQVAASAIARPQLPDLPLRTVCLHVQRLIFEQALVAMLQMPMETDNSGLATDENRRLPWKAGQLHNRSWTEEEWASWRRERGYRAWAGRASAW